MNHNKEDPISLFIPTLSDGGAQKVVVNLANEFVKLTNRPIHIVLVRAEGEFIHQVSPEIQIIGLDKERTLYAIPALVRYLRRSRPTVFCSSLDYANVCASIAWWLAGQNIQLIVREDGVVRNAKNSVKKRARRGLMHFLMRIFYRRAKAVVAISDVVAQSLWHFNICSNEKTIVIGNPVCIVADNEAAIEKVGIELNQKKFICAVGRLTEVKGFDILLEAFAQLSDMNLDLVILGEGSCRDSLKIQAHRLKMADRVHMPGFVRQPLEVIKRSELFVLSSRREGFGNVLVEALSTGVPIVSADCHGGPREILLNGTLGHLVSPEDPNALSEAIREALVEPRGTIHARQRRANDFAAPVIARKYLNDAFGLTVDCFEKLDS